ncbi:DUF4260 domain-containing protein [Undibacter mobilis]|uniref:DUF4260 family protein n=1 Tax=Undibacter mobilis TaxID=2292256 RepID=A0A371BCW2_9BRAD|nr:DUF4260 domain-containing protein [Undibacter mobilis]RDV05455.1 DUF4260 family protein [Undibacter mobilis]
MNETGSATGVPRLLVRAEGAALLAIAVLLYARTGESWWLFAALFLAPDLSFAGYLGGPRLGAIAYNCLHTLIAPAALGVAGLLLAKTLVIALALIWAAHIGFDRVLGYGLKYAAGFGFTHLGRIGRDARPTPSAD